MDKSGNLYNKKAAIFSPSGSASRSFFLTRHNIASPIFRHVDLSHSHERNPHARRHKLFPPFASIIIYPRSKSSHPHNEYRNESDFST